MVRIPSLSTQCIYNVHSKMKIFSFHLLIQQQWGRGEGCPCVVHPTVPSVTGHPLVTPLRSTQSGVEPPHSTPALHSFGVGSGSGVRTRRFTDGAPRFFSLHIHEALL